MRSIGRATVTGLGLTILLLLVWAWSGPLPEAKAEPGPASGEILLVYGVGGVLTRDGTLWQYRPDQNQWLTVDEAFSQEGQTTHILPLPVPASTIAKMDSFGFLVTESGSCWLYDLEKDRWREVGAPPSRR